MKHTKILAALAVAFSFLCTPVYAQNPAKPSNSKASVGATLPNVTDIKWTGDFDGMVKRRMIRVLVPYSKTLYFVDRGIQRGLVYDSFRMFEDDLNKKLKAKNIKTHVLFVPVGRDDIIPALLEGRGDIAAANLTITPERLKLVDFSDPITRNVSEIVVTGPGADPIKSVEELSGREIFLRKSSSFYESLQKLNAEFKKAGKAPVKLRLAPENLETEDILEMVNAGLIQATIADNHIAEFWKKVLPKIVFYPDAAINTGGMIGWMIRKNSPLLKAELNAMLARYPTGSSVRNQLLQKYLKSTKFVKNATSKEEMAKFERTVDFFRKYGDKYELDYLLLMALGYQESRLDQDVKSPVGAIGVMQVMPATGKDLNVGDITQLEPNIHAGVKYIRFMMKQYYENEPMNSLDKGLFAFASYNAGPGKISQLRSQAAERGLDPNKWFNNVEVVAAEKIGRETVQYVSNIYKYYLAYTMVTEQRDRRKETKKELKQEGGK